MPTPEFVLELRKKIGHDLLWLPGVIGVVFNDAGQVLLGQRSDNGVWTLVTGMLEPGEQPAQGLASRAVSGEAKVSDDESLDVRWFNLDDLPELPDYHLSRLRTAHSWKASDFEAQFVR